MKFGRPALAGALLLAGCDHSTPFAEAAHGDPGPRGTGNPLQVTYNPGTDLRPRWLPDGSGFVYTMERTDRADGDRCLAFMAARGGLVLELVCDRAPTSDDSVAAFEQAVVAADGRMAYLRAGTPLVPASVTPRTLELRLGTRTAPGGAIVRSLPYTAPSGLVHQAIESLQWLDATRLLYAAQAVTYVSPCRGCELDTVLTGLEVVTLDPAIGVPVPVPGTDRASSVAHGGNDTIYFSRDSGTTIERRVLSTGAASLVHEFGARVGEVTAGGGLVAAVSGSGALWLIRPGQSPALLIASTPTVFRRPALSPDGRRLVAEGYAVIADTIRVGGVIVAINMIVSRSSDLWLFDLP